MGKQVVYVLVLQLYFDANACTQLRVSTPFPRLKFEHFSSIFKVNVQAFPALYSCSQLNIFTSSSYFVQLCTIFVVYFFNLRRQTNTVR